MCTTPIYKSVFFLCDILFLFPDHRSFLHSFRRPLFFYPRYYCFFLSRFVPLLSFASLFHSRLLAEYSRSTCRLPTAGQVFNFFPFFSSIFLLLFFVTHRRPPTPYKFIPSFTSIRRTFPSFRLSLDRGRQSRERSVSVLWWFPKVHTALSRTTNFLSNHRSHTTIFGTDSLSSCPISSLWVSSAFPHSPIVAEASNFSTDLVRHTRRLRSLRQAFLCRCHRPRIIHLRGRFPARENISGGSAHSWPAGPPSSVNSHSSRSLPRVARARPSALHFGPFRLVSALSVAFMRATNVHNDYRTPGLPSDRRGFVEIPRPFSTLGLQASHARGISSYFTSSGNRPPFHRAHDFSVGLSTKANTRLGWTLSKFYSLVGDKGWRFYQVKPRLSTQFNLRSFNFLLSFLLLSYSVK